MTSHSRTSKSCWLSLFLTALLLTASSCVPDEFIEGTDFSPTERTLMINDHVEHITVYDGSIATYTRTTRGSARPYDRICIAHFTGVDRTARIVEGTEDCRTIA